MSATGLEVFDKTVQTTNAWLKEIMEATGLDRRKAYRALAAVLHALRDRLTVDEVAQLGAQLRGLYYDQWHHRQTRSAASQGGIPRGPSQLNWMTSVRSIRRTRRALSSRCSSTASPPMR